jgi:DNA helicase-2/ATP-dependent DNA helicase PcrA
MEDELFPSQMSCNNPRQLEEERRLFYVAITRAEEYLIITNAKSRFRFGKTEMCQPSRFLREIDSRYVSSSGCLSPETKISSSLTTTVPIKSIYSNQNNSSQVSAISQSKSPTGADARRFVRVTSSLLNSQGAVESYSSSDADRIHVGSKIIHERFGNGIITAIEGQGLDTKATVLFENVGIKQLLLRFAKFKVL